MSDTTILDYYFNDPGEVELHGPLVVPSFPKGMPNFTVVGWINEPDVKLGTPAYQSAQVWGAVATTLAYIVNLKSTPLYMTNWSTIDNLVAIPRSGNQLNAYYDRASLRFFWGKDPKTNVTIYTCDAVGIVAHELGHAILDGMRPDLWNTAVLEFFAFHEAFGDICGLASVLQHDMVIEQMLHETTTMSDPVPNLWQTNVVSRLAEQLGHAIYYSSKMVIGAERYLRNAFNDFKYVDPITLKLGTSDKELTQEPHNFGRIFSGAWYECFCELFKANYAHDKTNGVALVKEVRDIMMRVLLDAIVVVPSQLQLLQAMATTMVEVLEKQNKTKEAAILQKVFERRNLYFPVTGVKTPTLVVDTAKLYTGSGEHHMKIDLGATANSASKVINVELPKRVIVKNGANPKEILGPSVTNFLNYISDQGLLGSEDDNNMFAIATNGKLVRNYICSSFRAQPQIAAGKFPSGLAG